MLVMMLTVLSVLAPIVVVSLAGTAPGIAAAIRDRRRHNPWVRMPDGSLQLAAGEWRPFTGVTA